MKLYKITALLASIFSVIFSLSIIRELQKFVEPYVFIFVSIFLVLFVIYNEISKVRELQKFYKGFKFNKIAIFTTFIVSFFLSGIGIWFWTNGGVEVEIAMENNFKSNELLIERKHQSKIDSLNSIPVSSHEYIKLNEDINFWRNRKSDTKEQRQEILSNIRVIEGKRDKVYESLVSLRKVEIDRLNSLKQAELSLLNTKGSGERKNKDRNDFISIVFFMMVIVTEFIILNVQRQIANFYTPEQRMTLNILKDCELRNLKNIDINEFKFNKFNDFSSKFREGKHDENDWVITKNSFNLLKELNVTSGIHGELMVKNPSKFLSNYFNQINKF